MQPFAHCNMTLTNGFVFKFLIYFYFMYSVLPMYMCLHYIQCTGRPGGLEDSPGTELLTHRMVVSWHVGGWDLNMGLLE